ncbi:MAG: bifunctional 3-(3-hydroxy-phenyl)propionate/3-hydroxycinnamic acid hydroxylase [Novosphingobium sp.]
MVYDVAIVGCGPVGALAANLLGRAGLSTLVIEREELPFPLPRAVHLDHEMMRLFQAAGVIDHVAPLMRDTNGHLHVGADKGVIRYMGTVGKPRPFGWSNDYFFYQPELEDELRGALAAHANVELRLGVEFDDLRQEEDGVTLKLSAGRTTQDVRARWVIACDGSRSAVRKSLRIALEDLNFEEPWLVVDAEVDGPVRFPALAGVPAGADLQTLSVMMCDPSRPATVVPGPRNLRRWEFMLLPGEDDDEMMRPENVAALVQPYLAGVPHRLLRAATYRFHGLVAQHWQAGRVFLAGDAAHQTPPFFGQGMCHGFRDVANLAWKLAAVARGEAGDALLASYQPEREPHVRSVIAAAVDAGRYICILDPEQAAKRDDDIRRKEREHGSSTAADLIPPIGLGVVLSGTPGAGERFIQPRLADGRLLDDATGGGWRLFTVGKAGIEVSAGESLPELRGFDVTSIDDGGDLATWLERRGVDAVLVRPDFYVFGTGNAADLVAAAVRQLHRETAEAVRAA